MKDADEKSLAEYRPLHDFLVAGPAADIVLPLAEVEAVLGFPLPSSASIDPFWWRSTARNKWARSWLKADRIATLDAEGQAVTFTPGLYSPPVDNTWSVAQRRREENHARDALRYPPVDMHIRDRWWEPHFVYVVHVHSERLYKVGVTRHDARRLREVTARGRADVVTMSLMPNRHAARLVEIAVLDATDSARRVADRFNHYNGQTEHWDDSLQPPELEPIAEALALDESLPNWKLSLDSRGVDDGR